MKPLADKSVVVTGAGSGVGRGERGAVRAARRARRVRDLRTEWAEETVRRVQVASGTVVAVSTPRSTLRSTRTAAST